MIFDSLIESQTILSNEMERMIGHNWKREARSPQANGSHLKDCQDYDDAEDGYWGDKDINGMRRDR